MFTRIRLNIPIIYIYTINIDVKKQCRCKVKNCKGCIDTTGSNVVKELGDVHCLEIGKEEVFQFRAGVKRLARDTSDTPH